MLYSPPERLHGQSTFKPFKLFRFAIDGITAFTTWPLRMLSLMGICLSLLSFAYGLFIIVTNLMYGNPVQGWATLITVVLFFAGVQLISVGVLGEYIARIFGEVKRSEEHTSELQSLMRISYAVFCLKKKNKKTY